MTDNAQELIREMQENVAKYGRENTTTYLMVQAISLLQQQARELAAIGAGGVEPLRKCLHQIEEPASLAASAGSEPVAHLWQHSETGRTRVVMPDMVVDACATWLLVGPLYLHPSPPEGMVAAQALRKVLSVVQRYMPPGGPTAHDAMTEIIEIVDPWPLGPLEKP